MMDLGSKDLALEVEVVGTDAVAARDAVPAVGSRSHLDEFIGHDDRSGIGPDAVIDVERSDGSDEGGARSRVAEPPPSGGDIARGIVALAAESIVRCAFVDEQARSFDLSLCDGLGFGHRTLHYDVAVAIRESRCRRGRLGGLGDFRELRRVCLEGGLR
jgi:hypothetical protein